MDNPPRKWHQHPVVRTLGWVYVGLLAVQFLVVLLTDHSGLLSWVASVAR